MADPSLIAKPKMEYAQPARGGGKGKGLGILLFIAVLFVAIVGLIYGGVYLYRQNLEKSLDGLTRELSQLEKDLDQNIIEEVVRVDRGLSTARSLLAAHVYSSNLFSLLEEHTLADVYYTSFKYTFEKGGTVKVSGVAKTNGFATLHRQLEEFRSLPVVTDVVLGDIKLVDEANTAGMGFIMSIVFDENTFRFR